MPDWESASGTELYDSFVRGESFGDLLDDCQAIYAWRRRVTPPDLCLASPQEFMEWLEAAAAVPYAILDRQELAHFITMQGLEVGGGYLTDDKKQTLAGFLQTAKNRRYMSVFLASLGQLIPPLYVGETNNLRERARKHIAGDTDFGQLVGGKLKITWADLDLWYWPLAPASEMDDNVAAKRRRTMFELLVTRFTVAGCVSRPG